jgi:hypothetical protein
MTGEDDRRRVGGGATCRRIDGGQIANGGGVKKKMVNPATSLFNLRHCFGSEWFASGAAWDSPSLPSALSSRFVSRYPTFGSNLTISVGVHANVGQQVIILIDRCTWRVVGSLRKGQLQHIQPGMIADVHVMSKRKPNMRFPGIVDSIGFGGTPDADLVSRFELSLPDAQCTLTRVYLSSRCPVRVRVMDPVPELFRFSESAAVTLRGR